ncbi:SH3 domain-containing protein [Plectosphaerella cucumerina]|uniref:SH3 domain-containing protein n=1 Tax=Plectosphaerella cucumerina TaxID=40658 RepID=A0A8K0TNS4_9PEZI|nr:SH3 domain-containing protein [Plectosphaerella cucumerina]
MSQSSSPAASPPAASPSTNPNHPPLPPLVTSPPSRRSTLSRPLSHASKNRLSQYSTGSIPSRSRPPSHLFPMFPSSLSYTLVRDFAYPVFHPMHFGPPPEPSHPASGLSTPASESRRLSDPPASWENKMSWDKGGWEPDGLGRNTEHLAPMTFVDGPPWSEDEDLQSPVVSSRHRKHKSSSAALGQRRHEHARQARASVMDPSNYDRERGYYVDTTGDGSERYYVNEGAEANGPGGEFVTYPPDQARHPDQYHMGEPRQYAEHEGYLSDSDASSASSPGIRGDDQSRYSRDYQFTITSPDEEMHGKAVALFDFERENENELPLVEGQIIWVSYRHGQGWLVAEDPKTRESGLVPEEYVRLLRDIEGGISSLTGNFTEGTTSPNEVGTPTQADHTAKYEQPPPATNNNPTNGYHQPVVSTFSTSSKDLDPYPTQQLGIHAGQHPPQVVHYHGQRGGSQANTPTLSTHQETGLLRRGSQDPSGRSPEVPGAEGSDAAAVERSTTPKATAAADATAEPMDTDR